MLVCVSDSLKRNFDINAFYSPLKNVLIAHSGFVSNMKVTPLCPISKRPVGKDLQGVLDICFKKIRKMRYFHKAWLFYRIKF